MAKNNSQGKQQKSQSNQQQRITDNKSVKQDSGSAGGFKRSRKGNASDGTGSTGPRKK